MDLTKWTETYKDRASWALLEFIAVKAAAGHPAQSDQFERGFSVGGVAQSGLGRRAKMAIESLTADRSIARDLRGNGVAQLDLTTAGEELWSAVETTRSNPRHRERACQDAVLRWLYNHTMPCDSDGLLRDVELCHYLGSPFTPREVRDAGRALLELGLIEGEPSVSGPFPVSRVTLQGEVVIEDWGGDVTRGLRGSAAGGSAVTQNIAQQNIGSTVGPTAITMRGDVHQHGGIDLSEIAQLLAALGEAARDQGLQAQAEEAEQAALVVAADTTSLEVKKTAVQSVINNCVAAGFGAAGSFLPQLVAFVQSVV